MNIDFSFINGLVFGIAHSGEIFVEDTEDETLEQVTGIVIMLGFFQIVFYW
jgi:hypothetical protein